MVSLSQKLGLQLRQSPQQVLLSSLLQLPILSLEQKIKLELETNPLLEIDEEMELAEELEQEEEIEPVLELEANDKDGEASADDEEEEEEEHDELEGAADAVEEVEEGEVDWDLVLSDQDSYDVRMPRDDSAEVFERPEVAQVTLPEHLLSQLHMTRLNEKEMVIGEYIIWNINEDGYLSCSTDVIAENLDVSVEEVEKVLEVIQQFEPPGIAARNLQECLLIQLKQKEPRNELAIRLIAEHFEDFTNKRYEKIIKKVEITEDQLREVIEEIKRLNPKPGEGYVSLHENVIVPDLIVERDDGEFRVTLNDWNIPHLRINKAYRDLLLDKKKASKETRDYIRQRLESARWLINSINQRRLTILRVMEAIIRRQRDFFEKGREYIKPMILKDIADEIGMDISTVSRVTSGKYVQTEYGVFELKYFFSEGLRTDDGEDISNKLIKQRVREIIENEDPRNPLNDQKISEILKKEGLNVARRTVAKYREQMMIPVARLRRSI